jgi:hypothetical protein
VVKNAPSIGEHSRRDLPLQAFWIKPLANSPEAVILLPTKRLTPLRASNALGAAME